MYYIVFSIIAVLFGITCFFIGKVIGAKKVRQYEVVDSTKQFNIEDCLGQTNIMGAIHNDSEISHRCEVWVYDADDRYPRVRMCGSSMLHVINGATNEAISRLDKYNNPK